RSTTATVVLVDALPTRPPPPNETTSTILWLRSTKTSSSSTTKKLEARYSRKVAIRIGNVVTETIRTFRGTTVPVLIEKLTRSTRVAVRAESTFCRIVVRCCELTCTPACDLMLALDCSVVLLLWVDEPLVWFCLAAFGSCDCRFIGGVWDLLSDEALLSDERLVSDEPWPVVDFSVLSFEAWPVVDL